MSKKVIPSISPTLNESLSPLVIETCKKFLAATETIYLEKGYKGTTIRAISELSDRNIGTMHHYWGSKKALITDLCEQRFKPFLVERLAQYDAVEKDYKNQGVVDLKRLVRINVESVFKQDKQSLLFTKVTKDPAPEMIAISTKIFFEPGKKFIELIQLACPHLSPREFRLRVKFFMSSIFHDDDGMFQGRMAHFFEAGEPTADEELDYTVDAIVAVLSMPSK